MRRSGKEEATQVAKAELIGLSARIVASNDPTLLGQEGVVVDETKNTFRVEVRGREVVWPKIGQRFAFTTRDGQTHELEGHALAYQPENRIKKSSR